MKTLLNADRSSLKILWCWRMVQCRDWIVQRLRVLGTYWKQRAGPHPGVGHAASADAQSFDIESEWSYTTTSACHDGDTPVNLQPKRSTFRSITVNRVQTRKNAPRHLSNHFDVASISPKQQKLAQNTIELTWTITIGLLVQCGQCVARAILQVCIPQRLRLLIYNCLNLYGTNVKS